MSILLQCLYLFPNYLLFFSINQILIYWIQVSIIFIMFLLLFFFIYFLWFKLFPWGSKWRLVYNLLTLFLLIYILFPSKEGTNTLIYSYFIWMIWGLAALANRDMNFKEFTMWIIINCVVFTPLFLFLNNSFSWTTIVIVDWKEYPINYFNSDYFFLKSWDIIDRSGNKFINSNLVK